MGENILECRNITKSFFYNTVLKDVSFYIEKRSVIALVGENGAGKSTLMNIIGGAIKLDGGEIEFDGKKIIFDSPYKARMAGISFVHQELSLFDHLTVAENIMAGREPKGKNKLLSGSKLIFEAEQIMNEVGFKVPVDKIVFQCSPAEQQMVEIAKAYSSNLKLLILDEPTSSLNKNETEILFDFIRRIKEKGISVIFITHRMDEIFEVSDRVIVLKDGKVSLEEDACKLDRDKIISAMVGREASQAFPERISKKSERVIFSIKNAGKMKVLQDINLDVPEGKIVGIGGLEGQGQRELAQAVFGIQPFDSGECYLNGNKIIIKSPSQAIKNGISYIPDERKTHGLALKLGVRQNLTMLILKNLSTYGFLKNKEEKSITKNLIEKFNIKINDIEEPVQNLSGGNQQKIIFAKWMSNSPKLMVLHEPTRGIDVNSKLEIYKTVREMANHGTGVMLFSSDMMELIGLSDEIIIMYGGKIAGKLEAYNATEEMIMTLSAGLKVKGGEKDV